MDYALPDVGFLKDMITLILQLVEYFYTGKPYDADTETYTFRYRNYDPELNRWTTADPSGFPDGANNQIYTPSAFSEFDWKGLKTATISDGAWWFSVNYTLEYDNNSSPSIVGNPWLNGVTDLSGVPTGYEVNISNGVFQNVNKIELDNGTWKYTGQMEATIHLTITFGIKIGPITASPGYESSVQIVSNFEVYE